MAGSEASEWRFSQVFDRSPIISELSDGNTHKYIKIIHSFEHYSKFYNKEEKIENNIIFSEVTPLRRQIMR